MSTIGFWLTIYFLIGMLTAIGVIYVVRKYGEALGLDNMTRFLISDARLTFPLVALIGVPILVYCMYGWLESWLKQRKLTIRVRDRELVVLAYRDKQGRLVTQTINLDHESSEFLNDLEEEEFVQWMELIRCELNRTGRFDREVLLWHLYERRENRKNNK